MGGGVGRWRARLLVLPLVALMSGCGETPQQRAWRIAAQHEQHRAAMIGLYVAVAALVVAAIAARRRLAGYGRRALVLVAVSALLMGLVVVIVFWLALPPFVWPRDFFDDRPLAGPSPGTAAFALLVGAYLWAPTLILSLVCWRIGQRLRPRPVDEAQRQTPRAAPQ